MATQEELDRAKELLKINTELKGLRDEQISLNFSDAQSILDIVKSTKDRTLFESEILKSAKSLNKVYLDNVSNLNSINKLNNTIKATEAKIRRAKQISGQLELTLTKKQNLLLDDVILKESEVISLREKAAAKIDKVNRGEDKSINALSLANKWLEKANGLEEQKDDIIKNQLNKNTQIYLAQTNLTTATEAQLETLRDIDEVVGSNTRDILKLVSKIPIVGDVAKNVLESIDSEITGILNDPEKLKEFREQFNVKTIIKENLVNPLNAALSLVTGIVVAFGALSKAQTSFVRLTGENARTFRLNNDTLSTTVDLIETQVALTEQFGLNARVLFPGSTIKEASELTKAVGLGAEASGRFAQFSKITGTNLNESLDALTKSVPEAFSQRQILEETANVSSDIAVSLGSSTAEIGKAVIKARKLGLSLQQVNDIAGSLLDIESSIAAEFEAEVITGKQLNLERARFFALTNDLAGLTDEIANNQELINSFAGANRIEQEAIAGALGMSRQQMSDMVMKSDLMSTLTEEQRANAANVSVEQLKQLDAQTALADSFAKLTQTLTPFVTTLTTILNLLLKSVDAALVFASAFTLINKRAAILKGFQTTIAVFQKKNLLKGIAGMAIDAYRSVAKTPFIGPALGAAAAVAAYSLGKNYVNKADDIMSPGYGKRILSAPEGTFALNNKDTVIAGTDLNPPTTGTDLNRGGRNTNTTATISENDMNKLITGVTNAVMEGAEKGTSKAQINMNLDGNALARGMDSYLAVNTRKHNT